MKKILSLTIVALFFALAGHATTLLPIYMSSTTVCMGSSSWASDSSSSSGTWSSSDVAVATVGGAGLTTSITPVSPGVATITYTYGGSSVTIDITVNPTPAAITGTSHVCVGASTTLADATPGGVWSPYFSSDVTVGASSGVVTGVSSGYLDIEYTVAGCSAYYAFTVDPTSATVDSITGVGTTCVGSSTTLSEAITGGTWSTSASSVATVSGGVVTGVSAGTAIIEYTVVGTCGSAFASRTVTVTSGTSAGSISGPTSVALAGTIYLSDGVSGGTWSSSDPSIATISSTGAVTGVAAGTVTISYSVTACGSTTVATYTVVVPPFTGISGHVSFGTTVTTADVKVWLINYNPTSHLLTAVDSTVVFCSAGTSVYYQFLTEPTDSYRIKAAVVDSFTTSGTAGFMPTYHTSDFYWHDATVLYHVSSTADINQDIDMVYGTVTSGPGFIGGDVTTGANRGTSASAPAVGLHIFVLNSTGAIVHDAYTDATGSYSFSNLPVGTYTVFPEALQYATTALTSVAITSGAPTVSAANFLQHTLSFTITPSATGISNVTTATSDVVAFPNPTSGKLNIQWNVIATEKATVTVADVAGRIVYSSSLNMQQGAGTHQLDLSNLGNGLYILNIKSASINYNNKVEIAK